MSKFKDKPAEAQWLTPYLIVKDMANSLRFYQEALGLKLGNTMEGPDGLPVHAELQHKGRQVVMCAPEGAFGGTAKSPASGGYESPFSLYVYVDDVDAAFATAKAAGAQVDEEPTDQFWGDRTCRLTDPSGYSWMLGTHIGHENAPAPPEMAG